MLEFSDLDGDSVFVRPVRVAAVLNAGMARTHILFPAGEDPVVVQESFSDVLGVLRAQLVDGLFLAQAEEGPLAVNPRFVLSVTGDATGARITLSGGRAYDVSEPVETVLQALAP